MNYVCERLTVPPAEAYGVATFYAMFSTEERPPDGAARLRRHRLPAARGRRARPGSSNGVESNDGRQVVREPLPRALRASPPRASCRSSGEDGTADDTQLPEVSLERLRAVRCRGGASDRPRSTHRIARPTDRTTCGSSGGSGASIPRSIDDYRAHGGYEALRLALEHGPEWTIREITDAKLMGRGGAAFPTGREVEGGRRAAGATRTTSSATPTRASRARSRTAS